MSLLPGWARSSRCAASAILPFLTSVLVLLHASATQGDSLPVLLAAAAVGVLAVGRAQAEPVVRPLPLPRHPGGVARAVPSATAYWCSLSAPSCPRRPRAPGRG